MSDTTGSAAGAPTPRPRHGRHRASDAPSEPEEALVADAIVPEPVVQEAVAEPVGANAVPSAARAEQVAEDVDTAGDLETAGGADADLHAGEPAPAAARYQRRDTVTHLQPLPPRRDRRPALVSGVALAGLVAVLRRRHR